MRVEPSIRAKETPAEKKARIEELTRKVAIGFVFLGVFYFFIKLLFL
ncbi:MAG: hypothetical protein P4L41_05515 [Flavipsychrobacter sp.]|nr:hypothetical protein [Flavipsychrobacter sp.]